MQTMWLVLYSGNWQSPSLNNLCVSLNGIAANVDTPQDMQVAQALKGFFFLSLEEPGSDRLSTSLLRDSGKTSKDSSKKGQSKDSSKKYAPNAQYVQSHTDVPRLQGGVNLRFQSLHTFPTCFG